VLGRHLKYSCACWDDETTSLDDAQEQMLALIAERAGLEDGQRILDLGCGWGSLTLWLAERFPNAELTAVSNSSEHQQWIDLEARRRGLARVETLAADMNAFDTNERFDRVLSIEMFEHLCNWRAPLARVSQWLEDDGRLFLQMLTRRRYTRPRGSRDGSDWVSAYFLGGGVMPAECLLFEFQDDLTILDHWRLSGLQYRRTLDAWLANLEGHEADVMRVLRAVHGADARRRWMRLRLFFMTCAEFWGWDNGEEWYVSHYALTRPHGAYVRAVAAT
jgi:cyclopropane-fatty-acyl-phospholipid synthase